MNKYVFLLSTIKKLNEVGSWTGNTHIQKIINLAQSVTSRDLYKFVLHYYGPYSFELKHDVDMLVNAGYLTRYIDQFGYHYTLTEVGDKFLEKQLKNVEDSELLNNIEQIVRLLGKSSTLILELIATIDYVKYGKKLSPDKKVVEVVKTLKPHFNKRVIETAIRWWEEKRSKL